MFRKIACIAGLLVLAGCRANGSVPAPKAGLPPQATVDIVTVPTNSANNSIAPLLNDVDQSGTGLSVSAVAVQQMLPAVSGAVATTDGQTVSFTPPPNFIGVAILQYGVTDGTGALSASEIIVTVLPAALLPVALPDAATVLQNAGATDIDVLANDVDPAGGGLTLTAASVTASLPSAAQTVTIAGNKVRFTPAIGFAGVVAVSYTATDVNGNTADGVLSILVSPLSLAVGPVPLPDAAVVAQNSAATDINVLANDVDPAGGGLTLSGVSVTASVPGAAHSAGISGNKVRFTPAVGFAGTVVVSYTATDVNGVSANGVLNVVVSPLALPVGLVAIPDVATVAQDSGAVLINVLANDIDFAGGGLTLTNASVFSSLPSAVHTVAISANRVQFTPAAGFAGVVVVDYTATDVNGLTSNGVLDITVTPTALTLSPVAVPDVGTAQSSLGAKSFDVLANDIDPAGAGLTLTLVSITSSVPASPGSVAIVANKVQYTPSVAYIGSVLISYTATDVNGKTTTGQLSVTVTL